MADTRVFPCVICQRNVEVLTRTTTNPEAPEILKAPSDVWLGFVQGDHSPELIVVCSETCADALFHED
jgi:hypothetical protein